MFFGDSGESGGWSTGGCHCSPRGGSSDDGSQNECTLQQVDYLLYVSVYGASGKWRLASGVSLSIERSDIGWWLVLESGK